MRPELIGRRPFLRALAAAAMVGASVRGAWGAEVPPKFRIRRELFLKAPRPGVTVLAASYYTRRGGTELVSRHHYMTRSDTSDRAFVRYSIDNGRSWGDEREVMTTEKRADGVYRTSPAACIVDPRTGRLVEFRIAGVFPDDTPLVRLRGWAIHYAVSEDGGRSWDVEAPVVHKGAEFSPAHPLPGVWRGKNCAYLGDIASVPLVLADGVILVPIQIAPLGADGKLHNPGGGYTYTQAAVLRGRWTKEKTLEWEMSSVVDADPAVSTRGMIEPTVAELADGRLLMVMRGSNEKKPQLFSGRWASFSRDAGRTWTKPAEWTYGDGTRFYSPSACSQLLPHSSGRLFWLGNITPSNPVGNRPRYPFVIGEVDRASGHLRRESIQVVDDRGPDDSEMLALSNFYAREDRETREIVLHMTRQGTKSVGTKHDFSADASLYRITPMTTRG